MSKAEELLCNRCPQKENCDYIKLGRLSLCTTNSYFCEGYIQAEQDLKEKFKMWVVYNGYTAKDAEAVYSDFKQFIGEN